MASRSSLSSLRSLARARGPLGVVRVGGARTGCGLGSSVAPQAQRRCFSNLSHALPPSSSSSEENEYAFEIAPSAIRFGDGVTREVGKDLQILGCKKVLVVCDPNIAKMRPLQVVTESLEANGVPFEVYSDVLVEPTDASYKNAIAYAEGKGFDGYVALGGGSTIDTAKGVNLYDTYPPEDFLDYVNAPIGKGLPPPGQLKPLIAIPTTAGTGSEATGVAIFDLLEMDAKTGIGHRRLKPVLGLLDPQNMTEIPAQVAASAGLDVLCHALESLTAVPYYQRTSGRPSSPLLRPAYQGANPISEVWSMTSLHLMRQFFKRSIADPTDLEARSQMMLAASYAGVGFGNAGVHLCHGMSYPVSGMVRDYIPKGYSTTKPLVPHGQSVVLNAPAVFRFTGQACPDRHLAGAEALGADISQAKTSMAGEVVAETILNYISDLDLPNGLSDVGYEYSDIPKLVEGTLPQKRVTVLSPRQASEEDLAKLFEDALKY